jgi:hypothetical protein
VRCAGAGARAGTVVVPVRFNQCPGIRAAETVRFYSIKNATVMMILKYGLPATAVFLPVLILLCIVTNRFPGVDVYLFEVTRQE